MTKRHRYAATLFTLVIVALGVLVALVSAAAPIPSHTDEHTLVLAQAYDHVAAADAVSRNILSLYLRVAGVVWIAVEWIAAYVLWRTFRLLTATHQKAKVTS